MFFIVVGMLGIIIGLSFKEFKIEKFKLLYYIIGLQLGIRILSLIFYINNTILTINQIATLIILIYFLWHNRKQISIWIVGIGFILNIIVMIVNNGRMPVFVKGVDRFDVRHGLMTTETKLRILGDIISLPQPLGLWMPRSSIGDIIIGVGLMIIIAQLIYSEKIFVKIKIK